MPTDQTKASAPGREPETKEASEPRRWTPIFDGYSRSPPIDWLCPCGTTLRGNKTCIKCGRSPLDQVATPKPEAIRRRQLRKFTKAGGGW
jgi:hypothetical protein